MKTRDGRIATDGGAHHLLGAFTRTATHQRNFFGKIASSETKLPAIAKHSWQHRMRARPADENVSAIMLEPFIRCRVRMAGRILSCAPRLCDIAA